MVLIKPKKDFFGELKIHFVVLSKLNERKEHLHFDDLIVVFDLQN
jgi:hypothetical protein